MGRDAVGSRPCRYRRRRRRDPVPEIPYDMSQSRGQSSTATSSGRLLFYCRRLRRRFMPRRIKDLPRRRKAGRRRNHAAARWCRRNGRPCDLEERAGLEARVTVLGHLLRGGILRRWIACSPPAFGIGAVHGSRRRAQVGTDGRDSAARSIDVASHRRSNQRAEAVDPNGDVLVAPEAVSVSSSVELARLAGFCPSSLRDLGELGQGGMSVVYRARDKQLSRDVAVKILHDFLARQPDARKRFHRGRWPSPSCTTRRFSKSSTTRIRTQSRRTSSPS